MNKSASSIKINIKRFALLLGLGLVALLLSVLPKEKKAIDAKEDASHNNTSESAFIPTARADDIGGIALTGSATASSSCSGK